MDDANDTANFENLKLVNSSGATLMGPLEFPDLTTGGGDTAQTIEYSEDVIIEAGQTLEFSLLVNVNSSGTAAADDTIDATVDMSTVDAEDVNGDGLTAGTDIIPSSDLAGNTFTLTDASLDVVVASPPSSATYVKGASGVSFVAWSFAAGTASDIKVTDLVLTGHGDTTEDLLPISWDGSDVAPSDHIASCSLYDSESGALIDGPESFSAGNDGTMTFDGFDWSIPAGETMKMLAKCNLQNVVTDGGAGDDDDFYIEIDASTDVTATDDEGDTVAVTTGTFDGNNTPDVLMRVTSVGSLTASLDGSTPKETIVLGASTDVTMAVYKFTATNEPFKVKKIQLDNNGSADAIAAAVKVSYKNEAGTTVTKTGFLSGGSLTMSNLDFYVPTTESRKLTVAIDSNTVSSTGAASGATIGFTLDGNAADELEAVGAASGTTVYGDTISINVPANTMTVRKTKPTISLAAGSPSGAGVPGLAEVFRFNVSADSRGFITLNQVLFRVVTSGTAGDNWADCDAADLGVASKWAFYDASDPSTALDDDADWTFIEADGAGCTADTDMAWAQLELDGNATPAEEIGSGETKTYVLKIDTTGADSSADDSIRIDIPSESEADAPATSLDAINWEDDNETPSTGTTCDVGSDPCIDGANIKNLPVTGGTIVY
ncbi:hypothetical protein ACFLZY_03335 [Patescibacteria group bacterium]